MLFRSSSKNHSSLSSHIEDVLSQGDIVGEGISLLDEPLRLVSNRFAEHVPAADHQEIATEFEVVRKLGAGSYASSITSARFFVVLHLPRMIISILEPASNLMTSLYLGFLRLTMTTNALSSSYPRPTLMKKKLLPSSRRYVPRIILPHFRFSEKTIHQSITAHFKIVTLCRTSETAAFSSSNLFPVKISFTFWSRPAIITIRSVTETHSPHP